MALELTQIKEVLKTPVNRKQISKAISQENRIRLHCETTLSQSMNSAITEFLEFVRSLIPEDKFQVFRSLFRFPVKTVAVTEEIFDKLSKVFEGENPVYEYEFIDEAFLQDWEEYRTERLKEPHIWRTRGFEAMQLMINSVLVCDVPREQEGELPEPYFYWLDIRNVLDYDHTDGVINWIAFRPRKGELAVFDDMYFRVFESEDGQTPGRLIAESMHELGYCPAHFFWTSVLSYKEPDIKRSPLSSQLSNLDWLLYYLIQERHLDLYAGLPIMWGYASDCDFEMRNGEDPMQERYCDGGFIKDGTGNYLMNRDGSGRLEPCPKCSPKRLTGAGSFIEIDAPNDANGNANLVPPAGIIPIDRGSLDYNTEKADKLKSEIVFAITGYSGEPINNQAINADQVVAFFETPTQIIKRLKKEFEAAQKWVAETICRLRYGERFVRASISYGTSFYMYDPELALSMYKDAKVANLDDSILDMLQDHYFESKFRNDPQRLQYQYILLNLDPFRHLTKAQVQTMYTAGQISFEKYMLKMNFSSYIMRFEREQAPLLQFGTQTDFDTKINSITEILLSYASEEANNRSEGQRQQTGAAAGS